MFALAPMERRQFPETISDASINSLNTILTAAFGISPKTCSSARIGVGEDALTVKWNVLTGDGVYRAARHADGTNTWLPICDNTSYCVVILENGSVRVQDSAAEAPVSSDEMAVFLDTVSSDVDKEPVSVNGDLTSDMFGGGTTETALIIANSVMKHVFNKTSIPLPLAYSIDDGIVLMWVSGTNVQILGDGDTVLGTEHDESTVAATFEDIVKFLDSMANETQPTG